MDRKYNRILLKLSGEVLAGDKKQGIDFDTVENVCKIIKKCTDTMKYFFVNTKTGEKSGEMLTMVRLDEDAPVEGE